MQFLVFFVVLCVVFSVFVCFIVFWIWWSDSNKCMYICILSVSQFSRHIIIKHTSQLESSAEKK